MFEMWAIAPALVKLYAIKALYGQTNKNKLLFDLLIQNIEGNNAAGCHELN